MAILWSAENAISIDTVTADAVIQRLRAASGSLNDETVKQLSNASAYCHDNWTGDAAAAFKERCSAYIYEIQAKAFKLDEMASRVADIVRIYREIDSRVREAIAAEGGSR